MPTVDELAAICRSWTPYSLAAFYEWVFAEQKWTLPAHFWPVCLALTDMRIHNFQLIIGPGCGKAVSYDTNILTTEGWVSARDIKVGQKVRTPDGGSALIKGRIEQPISMLYRVVLEDGRSAVVNGEHLWKVCTRTKDKMSGKYKFVLKTTKELLKYKGWSAKRLYLPFCEPISFSPVDISIPAYTLGCILGDGHIGQTGSPRVVSHEKEIFEYIKKDLEGSPFNFSQHISHNFTQAGITGCASELKQLGLAPSRSESVFVPAKYKYNTLEIRWDILRGLMDTDGTVDSNGCISFTSTSYQLARDVQEIIWSLGGYAKIGTIKKPFYTNKKGEKIQGQNAYNVFIRHPWTHKLFTMKRKIERTKIAKYTNQLKLRIKSIEEISENESVCISIDHPDGLFLIDDYIVTHNSQMLSVIFPTWLIGHDPAMTVLGISGGEALMQGFQQAAGRLIESSPAFLASFPNVKPDKSAGWSSERGLFVTGHPPGVPDANYLAAGMNSTYVTGMHAKTLIVDDLHNKENSSTAAQCQKVKETYYNTIIGRADPMGARIIVAGRRWSTEDVYGSLIDSEDFVTLRLPFMREGEKQLYFDVYVPDGMDCVFTDRKVHCGDGEIISV